MNRYIQDPELIQEIYVCGIKTQMLRIAIRLDIFSILSAEPMEVTNIARICGCDLDGMEKLLDCLSSYHLLEKNGKYYTLSLTSMTFLVRSNKSYAGDWILAQTNPDIFEQVYRSVRSGKPFRPLFPWDQLAWLESYNPKRIIESNAMWEAARIDPALLPRMRVLDLACGSSIMSFVIAQKAPNVRIICVDTPKVLEVAKDLAVRMGVLDQVSFMSGDLHQLDLGTDKYEIALLGNVTNFFTVEQNMSLFQRINRSLTNEGSLIINVTMDTGEMNPHVRQYSFVLWTMSGTRFYDFHNYQDWLLESGFYEVKQLNKQWISAKKIKQLTETR